MSNTFVGGIKLPYMNPAPDIISAPFKPTRISLGIPDGYRVAVKHGDKIAIGDEVAVSEDGNPNILSGISGTVSVSHYEGQQSVTVENDFCDTVSEKCIPLKKNINELSEADLTEALLKMGIAPPSAGKKSPVCLIINCCEPDSHSSSVTRTLLEKTEEVIGGARILMKLLGAGKAICAVPKPMYKCANDLGCCINDSRMIKIRLVSGKYPQHEPHMLVSSLFNIEINPSVPVSDAGYPVVSAVLCAAVFDALAKGLPFTSSIITVSEEHTASGNYTVPFGTEINELIPLCGDFSEKPEKIRIGGVMTGKETDGSDHTKPDTSAIILNKQKRQVKLRPCLHCGRCSSACPVRLQPSLIFEYSADVNHEITKKLDAEYCIACGCCSSVCPAGIDLRAVILSEKAFITEKGAAYE